MHIFQIVCDLPISVIYKHKLNKFRFENTHILMVKIYAIIELKSI